MKKTRGFELVTQEKRTLPDEVVKLPLRGTKTSAGYDFYATVDLVIRPQEKVVFKTDVKAYMRANEALLIDVRSSMGTKEDLMITNTLGVVDSDYYSNPDNDGNIMIGLRNLKKEMEFINYVKIVGLDGNLWDMPIIRELYEENAVYIKTGDRVAQGIFIKYLEADNGNTETERISGTGSTGE